MKKKSTNDLSDEYYINQVYMKELEAALLRSDKFIAYFSTSFYKKISK